MIEAAALAVITIGFMGVLVIMEGVARACRHAINCVNNDARSKRFNW